MKFIVIKEDFSVSFENYSYVGCGPYTNEDDARTAVFNNFYSCGPTDEHKIEIQYYNNETRITFSSTETGELFAIYHILVTML